MPRVCVWVHTCASGVCTSELLPSRLQPHSQDLEGSARSRATASRSLGHPGVAFLHGGARTSSPPPPRVPAGPAPPPHAPSGIRRALPSSPLVQLPLALACATPTSPLECHP